ncbi:hypothetical protein D3C81_1584530 [compost metagenome]
MHLFQLRQGQGQADAVEVDRLAAAHARGTRGVRQHLEHGHLPRRRNGRAVGQQHERLRLQRVADQQGRRFIVGDVHGGLATAQGIVIHARHVIMHERIHVNHFQRASCAREDILIGIKQFTRRHHQQRAHAFAAAQERIAHGRVQLVRHDICRRQELVEPAFHAGLGALHPVAEGHAVLLHAGHHWAASPASTNGFNMSPSNTFTCASTLSSWVAQYLTSSEPRW